MGKPQEDRDDIRIIAESLIRFGKMPWEELRQHLEDHREDLGCGLKMPSGGHRQIGRDAMEVFSRLAKRHAEKDPDGEAIDLEKLNGAIRSAFVDIFIRSTPAVGRTDVDRPDVEPRHA